MGKKRDLAESVRIVRLEVSKVGGDWKETTGRWHEQQQQCREMANMIWQEWLVWHVLNRSADKLRAWLDARKRDGIKAAGKCPIESVPSCLAKEIYSKCSTRFGSLHSRVRVLLQNKILQGIKSRKASSGSLPGWSAILLCHESVPSFTKGVPIPFDVANTELVIGEDGVPVVELRTTRDEAGRKSGSKTTPSILDRLVIWSGGRRVRSQIDVLKLIVKGEFKFCGSQLSYNRQLRKWFVMLSYRRPVHRVAGLDAGKTAYLIPGRRIPFVLRFPHERGVWLQQRGEHIAAIRRRTCGERRSRNANYRRATARKGKGFEHANSWRDGFSRLWSEFVRRVNHAVSHDAVKECVNRGYGKLVLCKPSGVVAEHRAVATLGASGMDQTTWEFFQLKTMLEYKCQDLGVEFSVVEFDGSKSVAKESGVEVAA